MEVNDWLGVDTIISTFLGKRSSKNAITENADICRKGERDECPDMRKMLAHTSTIIRWLDLPQSRMRRKVNPSQH